MKDGFIIVFCLLGISLGVSTIAHAGPDEEEINISHVFIPRKGFDDNDHVQFVLEGNLPSSCYTLGNADAKWDSKGKTVRVRQYAWRRTAGPCGTGDLIEGPVPFTNEVSLGRLKSGIYQINFTQNRPEVGRRTFGVEAAPSTNIDNLSYAVVRNVIAHDLNFENAEVQVEVTGLTTSSCLEPEKELRVEKQNDVFVILPVQTQIQADCQPIKKEFSRKVNLGFLMQGQYLLHVRSMNGVAVNRTISVIRGFLP
jgi:hypothetical protein